MSLLIHNVRILNPSVKLNGNNWQKLPKSDVLVEDGSIKKIVKAQKSPEVKTSAKTLDGEGQCLIPGLIDLHTHFREPGYEGKETIQTGSRAALRGGFVASVSMPNTSPACDSQSVIDNIQRKAREVPYHIFPCGTLSKGREGKELSEMADLKQAGIVAVSDDGSWVHDSLLMRRAMEYASMLDLIVMSHCEDLRLSAGGVMNEGLMSTKLGLKGIPAASEVVAVARDIELARLTKARLHVCHISTARSVELVRRAKEDGISITAEVTPHNMALTDECLEGYNTNYKMYPPLRIQKDVDAVIQALKDGVIDNIATDHAPHTQEDKMAEFDSAPFGTIGLETAFAASVTELIDRHGFLINDVLRFLCTQPAKILGLESRFGLIEEGREANVTLVDLNSEWVVSSEDFLSKSKNSCFLGRKLKGKILATVCAGKLWNFKETLEGVK